jgi:hypothetical protein
MDFKSNRFNNSLKCRPDYIKVPDSSHDVSVEGAQGVTAPFPIDGIDDGA